MVSGGDHTLAHGDMRPHTTEMRDLTAACALRLEVQQPNHGTVATPLVVSLRHISDTAHKDSRSLHSRVYPLSLHHAAFTADRQDAETLTLRCGDSSRRCQQAVSAATSQPQASATAAFINGVAAQPLQPQPKQPRATTPATAPIASMTT